MQQLLKITTTPIQYDLHIEPAHLQLKQAQNPRHDLLRDPSALSIRTRTIQVRLDTTELRASLNLRTSGEFARHYAEQGRQTAYRTIGEQVQFGNQMAQIQDGVTISQLVRQRMLEQPTTYTTFIPSVGPEIAWQPAETDIRYDPGSVTFDWKVMQNQMEFIPGRFQLQITQYPRVEIEYLGKPNYVPPSSSPDGQADRG